MRGAPRGEQTGTLALLFPDTDARAIRTPLSAALTHGVEDFLYERRISLMVTHLREEARLPVCLEKRQVDAMCGRVGGKTQHQHLGARPTGLDRLLQLLW